MTIIRRRKEMLSSYVPLEAKQKFPEISPAKFPPYLISYHMILFESIADKYNYMIPKIWGNGWLEGSTTLFSSLSCTSFCLDT